MSARVQQERKYVALWHQIRTEKELTVQLQPPNMSAVQGKRSYNTLKKAVSKEKYQDIHYRKANPHARLTFKFDEQWNTITFSLEDSTQATVEDL